MKKTWLFNLSSSYTYEEEEGVFAESQFVFDLKLPLEFKPRIGDGEVQDFYLLPIDQVCITDILLNKDLDITKTRDFHFVIPLCCFQVKELLATDDFKPNCAMVVLDFLIRHSFIEPDTGVCVCLSTAFPLLKSITKSFFFLTSFCWFQSLTIRNLWKDSIRHYRGSWGLSPLSDTTTTPGTFLCFLWELRELVGKSYNSKMSNSWLLILKFNKLLFVSLYCIIINTSRLSISLSLCNTLTGEVHCTVLLHNSLYISNRT